MFWMCLWNCHVLSATRQFLQFNEIFNVIALFLPVEAGKNKVNSKMNEKHSVCHDNWNLSKLLTLTLRSKKCFFVTSFFNNLIINHSLDGNTESLLATIK